MRTVTLRDATHDDKAAIRDLNTRTFGRENEAGLIARLEADGDVLMQMLALMDEQVIGHVLFYPVRVFGKLGASGLGPMSVDPWVQREGVGTTILNNALKHLQSVGMPIVFVLGHPAYYARFGFTEATAKPFEAPWTGPNFMAARLRHGPPMSGRLIFPAAFEV
ncbi:MAG: N-acetyltransferase [Alphaproteobacteria bacterium]|nr:N-acetyltransferase [Alphaproteobacteria bacterium]